MHIDFRVTLESDVGFILDTDLLDTGLLGFLETPVDLPIRSASWSRGRDSIFTNFSAGSCQIEFDDKDRVLDPNYKAGPLYGQLYPGRAITLYGTYTSTKGWGTAETKVFHGYIDNFKYDYDREGQAIVTISAIDIFSRFANANISSLSVPEELSGARITRILNYMGVPAAYQAVSPGYSLLAAETITTTNVLEYLNKIALSELGLLYVRGDGAVTFQQRNPPNIYANFGISNIPNSLYIDGINFDYSTDRLTNSVKLMTPTLTSTASDSESIEKYGTFYNEFDSLVSSQTQLDSLSRGLVSLYKTPVFVCRSASVNFNAIQQIYDAVDYDLAEIDYFGILEIGGLCSAFWDPPQPDGVPPQTDIIINDPLLIVGVSHSVTPGSHVCAVKLDNAFGTSSFILNDASMGVLDGGKLGL
jgi:hypothetical protein